jgi:hypothetical protein
MTMSRDNDDERDNEDEAISRQRQERAQRGHNEDEWDEGAQVGGEGQAADEATGGNPLLLPGIFMIVTGVINLLFGLGGVMVGITFANMPEAELQKALEQQDPQQRAELEKQGIGVKELRQIYVYGGGGGGALWLVCSLLTVIGGACMCARKARGLAILSAVVTAVPCVTSPCCLFGLPVGIWSLVVLLQGRR